MEEKVDAYYRSTSNQKALLKILAVLFLNHLFDIFHSDHNITLYLLRIYPHLSVYILNTIDR